MNPKCNASSPVNLSNQADLDLESTMDSETGIALVLSLQVFSSVEGNPSGSPMFVFIPNLLHSGPNVSISGLFLFRNYFCVTAKYLYLYIIMSYGDF